MKITEVTSKTFFYSTKTVSDDEGHTHPDPDLKEHKVKTTLFSIHTDEGISGYSFGVGKEITENVIAPILVGEDPFYREKLWQKLNHMQRIGQESLNDKVLSNVDLAIWDTIGKSLKQPINRILGLYRDKVPAYASTMCGDEMNGGLSTPEEYAKFAEWCIKERGYQAFKLHTWYPPIKWAPDPKMDIKACAAVREAVGDDIPLMLDPHHNYSRLDALWIGKELEKLNFHWMEEPMDESSMSSYIWLSDQLDLPILGPETMQGKLATRAEWITNNACDILRGGVGDVGGLTPLMKIIHLAESFNMALEVHGGGAGNLHALLSMAIPGELYERGLLHPFIDHEEPPAYLNNIMDPMDNEGLISMPPGAGLGWDINFDYINNSLVD